ncbi:MAG: hypothetical protein IJY71_02215 [Clostridia bacterium]|nr:hypothetical protein [Clostridia bacterium]
MKERILGFLKGRGWLLALAAAGLLLLLLGSGGASGTPKAEGKDALAAAEAYRASLTEEITALCERVEGVSGVSVLLTLERGECAFYAQNKTQTGESPASVGGEALLLGYEMPKVEGVAVVCRGGDSVAVQAELTALLSAALGIPSSRVCVSGGKIS